MPTSLMFVALVGAWLVVLVPMVARRRQQVVRTADSALNARVLRRGGSASAPTRRASGMAMRSHTVGAASSARVRKVCSVSEFDDYDEYDEEDLEAAYEAEATGGGWVRERDHRRPADRSGDDLAESESDYADDYAADEYAADDYAVDDTESDDYADEPDDGPARERFTDIPAARVSDDERAEVELVDGPYDEPAMNEDGFEDDAAPIDRRTEHAGGPPRPYRPGRGGFDPEVAELTARARYSFRQRIVVVMLLAAVGTGLAAGLVLPMLWWVHGCLDLLLVGYLAYLRRQVRIEEAIRQRRMARLADSRRPVAAERPAARRVGERRSGDGQTADETTSREFRSGDGGSAERPPALRPARRTAATVVRHPGAARVELDDEDPVFDELGEPAPVSYRRAVGE